MKKLSVLLSVCGVLQIVLGLASLLVPTLFFVQMGLAAPPSDNRYMIGMLAARFLAYGVALIVAARQPARHALWIGAMAAIQAMDLAVGLWYTAVGVLSLSVSAFPMFNAAILLMLLVWWGPWRAGSSVATIS
jgi:hypothetical protein